MLGHQLPIGQDFGVQNAAQCVGEDIRVIPVVETPLQFFQVTIKMLDAHVMECSDNRPLEQTPHAFDAVGVDLADNPLLRGVAHGLVYGVVISNPHVGLQLIGVNGLGLILDGSTNEIVEGSLPDIGDALDSDLASLPLDGTGHPSLAFLASRSYFAPLSTYQCFVHFDDTEQGGSNKGIVAHGLADAVAQVPSRPVGGPDGAPQLVGRNTLLRFAHEVDRQEPLTEGQVRIVHAGPGGYGELVAA